MKAGKWPQLCSQECRWQIRQSEALTAGGAACRPSRCTSCSGQRPFSPSKISCALVEGRISCSLCLGCTCPRWLHESFSPSLQISAQISASLCILNSPPPPPTPVSVAALFFTRACITIQDKFHFSTVCSTPQLECKPLRTGFPSC